MRLRNSFTALMILLAPAVPLFAAVSKNFEEWSKGPAQHLMTEDELRGWPNVRSDAEAQAFIDLFWARRDPTPATPRNEFKEDFENRIKVADERFKEGSTRGSMTERGKTLILIGAPSRITRKSERSAPPTGTGEDIGGSQSGQSSSTVTETWVYEGERVPSIVSVPKFELTFREDFGAGKFRSGRSQINLNETMQKAVQQAVKSPELKEVPKYSEPEPRPKHLVEVSVPAPSVTPTMTSFKTQSLQTAVNDFKAARTSLYKDVYVTYGEFMTPSGDYFVPVQLYMTKNPITGKTIAPVETPAGQTTTVIKEPIPEKPVTFFGVVENAQGEIVAVYEDPLLLQSSKNEFFADKSITLPPGKYTGSFGIASEGKPLAIARTQMDLAPIEREAAGISRLIISNNIYPLTVAQQPTDPFAFGGIKVVPKGDRAFTRQDELWYFFELRNPGVAPTTLPATKTITESSGATSTSISTPAVVQGPELPKIQVKVDVEAKSGQRLSAPLQEAAAEQLKGVPGRFGVGASIPLAGFSPGDYTIKLKVIDTITKQTYNLQEKFRITG